MTMLSSNFPQLIAGPIIGYEGENLLKKTIRYKVLTVTEPENGPTFSLSSPQKIKEETLYKTNQVMFKRFVFKIPLTEERSTFTYFVNTQAFKVKIPGTKQERTFDFCTCNDFHSQKDKNASPEPDHMWRIYQEMLTLDLAPDLFIFGGDQGYFDSVFEMPNIKKWSTLCKHNQKEALNSPFTLAMAQEADAFYYQAYLKRFSNQNDFGKTIAQVPVWMSADDHDWWDGKGSYETAIENCQVVKGLAEIAKKYFYLFQLQSFPDDALRLPEFSGLESTKFRIFGKMAILAPDTRSFRTQTQVIHPNDWQLTLDFLATNKDKFDHAVFVFPIPFIYTNFNNLEKILKALNILPDEIINTIPFNEARNQLNDKFGEVDLIDDLADHWNSAGHSEEMKKILADLFLIRSWGKSVLIVSGDVHHGCETEVRSKEFLLNENDPYLIKNVITSSIVNKISFLAPFIPATFAEDQELTEEAIGRLVKINPVLPSTSTGTNILDQHNFVRITEKTNGLTMEWLMSCGQEDREKDTYANLKRYKSFTPMYRPISTSNENLLSSRLGRRRDKCLIM